MAAEQNSVASEQLRDPRLFNQLMVQKKAMERANEWEAAEKELEEEPHVQYSALYRWSCSNNDRTHNDQGTFDCWEELITKMGMTERTRKLEKMGKMGKKGETAREFQDSGEFEEVRLET